MLSTIISTKTQNKWKVIIFYAKGVYVYEYKAHQWSGRKT